MQKRDDSRKADGQEQNSALTGAGDWMGGGWVGWVVHFNYPSVRR